MKKNRIFAKNFYTHQKGVIKEYQPVKKLFNSVILSKW